MWRSIFNSILLDFSISRLPTALGCESHGQAGLANNMMQMQQYMPERYPPFKHKCARLQMGLWWCGNLVGGGGGLWGFLLMGLMELVGVGGEGLPEHVSGGLSLILGKWIAQAPHICPLDIVQVFYWFPTLCPSMKPWLEGGSVKTEVRPPSLIFPPSIDSTPHCHWSRLQLGTTAKHCFPLNFSACSNPHAGSISLGNYLLLSNFLVLFCMLISISWLYDNKWENRFYLQSNAKIV